MFKSATVITYDAIHKNHAIDWQNVSIKDKENYSARRIIKESIHITAKKTSINRGSRGYKLPSLYMQLLSEAAPSSGNSNHNSSEEGHRNMRPKQSA